MAERKVDSMHARVIRRLQRRARRGLGFPDSPRRAPVVLRLGGRGVGAAVRGALYGRQAVLLGRRVPAEGALFGGEADDLRVRVGGAVGGRLDLPLPRRAK